MIEHLGIIMDGNRRWAKERLLPSFAWHKSGADNVERIIEWASDKWIKYLTLWWLATENLAKRSKDEINGIIKLINSIETRLDKMIQNGLRFDTIWDISQLPDKTQNILKNLKEKTKNNIWITLILALVYGWQDEIIRWIKDFITKWSDINNLTRESFRDHIDTWKYPKVDVIVRTGWDIRHSGFLLYDSEYSEYYFTEKKWPDFWQEELEKVIAFFEKSKRNFGK
jgi:undecaprenyl diphosphate synthase